MGARGAPIRACPSCAASGKSSAASQAHWASNPSSNPPCPPRRTILGASSPRQFCLAKLESVGLHPNPLADKRTLIRRVTFDLTGLPRPSLRSSASSPTIRPAAYAKSSTACSPRPLWRAWAATGSMSPAIPTPRATRRSATTRATRMRGPYRDYVIDASTRTSLQPVHLEQLAADRLVVDQEDKAKAKKVEPPMDRTVLAALAS